MPYSKGPTGSSDERESTGVKRPRAARSLFAVRARRVEIALPIVILVLTAMVQLACRQDSKSSTPTPTGEKTAATQKVQVRGVLQQGGKAYVRIKEFHAESRKTARPKGEAQVFHFGDAVELDARQDVGPTYWLVSDGKGGPQSWIPGYLLTPSIAEIDMLRDKNRVPETMTYIYEQTVAGGKFDARQHGRVHLPGTPIVATINGDEGVAITDQGSSQVAFRGNAVVFDEAVFKQEAWAFPMVFSDGNRKVPMAAGKMFYCTEAAGDGKFDILELP